MLSITKQGEKVLVTKAITETVFDGSLADLDFKIQLAQEEVDAVTAQLAKYQSKHDDLIALKAEIENIK